MGEEVSRMDPEVAGMVLAGVLGALVGAVWSARRVPEPPGSPRLLDDGRLPGERADVRGRVPR